MNKTEPGVEDRGPVSYVSLNGVTARTRLTKMLGWSAGDEHRHVCVVGRNKGLVRLSQRVGHGIA